MADLGHPWRRILPGQRLRFFHPEKLGIPVVGHRNRPVTPGRLVHQRPLTWQPGCRRSTSSSFLALLDRLLPVMKLVGKISLGTHVARPISRDGLGLLPDERHRQPEPDHHHWRAILRLVQRSHWCRHARLGCDHCGIAPDGAQRMAAGCRASWRALWRSIVGFPLAVVTAQELGRFSLFRTGADLLPDPGCRSSSGPDYVGTLDCTAKVNPASYSGLIL